MLTKRYRLQRSSDLQRVRHRGQSWRHSLAILLVTVNDLEVSRFAFAAGRSVGGAVVRNRAKRLMREAVRLNLAKVNPGFDCLLIGRQSMAGASFSQVESAVLALLHRAKLLTETTSVNNEDFQGS